MVSGTLSAQPEHTNRLIQEKSPYLLQHAHNPVDWYPWGNDAFEKAKREHKPIFLSIGYSTCHWCHVMERESFENHVVADYLNKNYVAIKVDREERPDIDNIYMSAVQSMTGSGGWPLSVFLTTDLKPFYGGTYFPPKPAYGRPSFMDVLQRLHEAWIHEYDTVLESGKALTHALNQSDKLSAAQKIDTTVAAKTLDHFVRSFDSVEGGFGSAPKFPRPVQFDFLFSYYAVTGDVKARDMPLFSLRKMAEGGMHDHLSGGFHRYSTDRYWRVSHFEKMLYDQAQLVQSYLDAFQITHDTFYSDVARDIIRYVLEHLASPEGGFYSAEDADSEGEEGTFYVWSKQEIDQMLGEDAPLFEYYFGVEEKGNFEANKNVLYIAHTLEQTAQEFKVAENDARTILDRGKAKLNAVCEKRMRPFLDDKVLASWNGLMIGALSRAGSVLQEPKYIEAAGRAADFVWSHLHRDRKLLHRWRDGMASIDAFLDSYAFLIKGYLDLYEATFDSVYLEHATTLQKEQDERLWDANGGGYFMAGAQSDLLLRSKPDYDGAEPSGNSVSAINLFRLAAYHENDTYRDSAMRVLAAFSTQLNKYPWGLPEMVTALEWSSRPPAVMVYEANTPEAALTMHSVRNKYYVPFSVSMFGPTSSAEFARTLTMKSSQPTVYLCKNFTCDLPQTSIREFEKQLAKLLP